MSAPDTDAADWGEAMSGIEEAGQEGQEKRHRTYISEEDKLDLIRLCVLNQDWFHTIKEGANSGS
jgi:hypothetical protein